MQFSLERGLTLRHGQRVIQMNREISAAEVQFEDVRTGRMLILKTTDVLQGIWDQKYQLVLEGGPSGGDETKQPRIALSEVSADLRVNIDRRYQYIQALAKAGVTRGQRAKIQSLLGALAQKLGDSKPPSTSTVMGWMRRYEKSSLHPGALVDLRSLTRRGRRLTVEIELLIQKVLKREYFTKARHSIRHAHDQIQAEILQSPELRKLTESMGSVSYSTVRRRVEEVDLYSRISSREGVARARHETRVRFGPTVVAYPMAEVQIDHTPLNWVVICDRTGLPLGRPILTIALDPFSGYVLGFYLSFYGPGVTSVAGVLRSAINLKDDICAPAKLTNPWLARGLPDCIVIDNGLEFHSFAFRQMAMALGIDLTYCRVRTPWLKPQVERFFGSLNFLTLASGRVRKSKPNEERIDPYAGAGITFSNLFDGLLQYFVDVYPFQYNPRKLACPFDLYREGIERCPPARYPQSMQELRLAAGLSKMLTMSAGGIQLEGLSYATPEFGALVKKIGKQKVLCKWDPDDMGQLHVQTPNNGPWITAHATDGSYANGLSYNQHRMISKIAREEYKDSSKPQALIKAKARLHDHWQNTTSRNRKGVALLAARSADYTSARISGALPPASTADSSASPSAASLLLTPTDLQIEASEIPDFDAFSARRVS